MSSRSASSAREARAVAMSFTAADVVRHTWMTWYAFLALLVPVAVFVAFPGQDGFTFTVAERFYLAAVFFLGAGIIGLVGVWVGAPLAWLLGRALRRVGRPVVHILAFGILGTATFAVITLFDRGDPPFLGRIAPDNPIPLVLLGVSFVCCAFGRAMAYRASGRAAARIS